MKDPHRHQLTVGTLLALRGSGSCSSLTHAPRGSIWENSRMAAAATFPTHRLRLTLEKRWRPVVGPIGLCARGGARFFEAPGGAQRPAGSKSETEQKWSKRTVSNFSPSGRGRAQPGVAFSISHLPESTSRCCKQRPKSAPLPFKHGSLYARPGS